MPHIYTAVLGTPSTEWFNLPVTKDVGLAGVPGTPDAAAMGEYGAINIPHAVDVSAIHLHQIDDGTSSTTALEVFRRRSGAWLKIASVSLASGGGDFQTVSFTWVDLSYKSLQAWDYLYLQATGKMGGTPKGFVDVHFENVWATPAGSTPV